MDFLNPIINWWTKRQEKKRRQEAALNAFLGAEKRPLADILPRSTPADTGGHSNTGVRIDTPELPPMPEGVDLAALWEEPNDPSALTTIFSAIGGIAAIITLIVVLMK